MSYVKITDLDEPKSLASGIGGIPNGAASALIRAEGGDVRWRDDGVPASTVDGFRLYAGESFAYDKGLLSLSFIQLDDPATLHVFFY